MIVVDTNVLFYLCVEGDRTKDAEALLDRDPFWVAPTLWRSEFRNVLAGSDCTAYDCEFVALAMQLGTKLVTADKKLLRSFPEHAQPLLAA